MNVMYGNYIHPITFHQSVILKAVMFLADLVTLNFIYTEHTPEFSAMAK